MTTTTLRRSLKSALAAAALASGLLLGVAATAQAEPAVACEAGPDRDLRGCDFSGQDLSWMWLQNSDLTGANLSGAQLVGAYLWGANLTNANLTNANFSAAYLYGARLSGASVSGANLSATLANVRSGAVVGRPASMPDDWRLLNGHFIGPGADLTGADLSGLDLQGLNLSQVRLRDAIVDGTEFAGADLSWASSGGLAGAPASLPGSWRLIRGYLVGPAAQLSNEDLTGFDLSDAELAGAQMEYATLRDAVVEGANFAGASMWGVRSAGVTGTPAALPEGWRLSRGYFIGAGANLAGSSLGGLDLSYLSLDGASLAGADLTGALLLGASLSSADLSGALLMEADLTLANLDSAYLAGADLSSAILTESWIAYADLTRAVFADANLVSANLYGAVLNEADFSDARLMGANVEWASLVGTNLDGASLESASLWGAYSDNVRGKPSALPDRWELRSGFLMGQGANLQGIDLHGQDLSGVDFGSAYLAGADLSDANIDGTSLAGADLTGVRSGGITGSPGALPDGWRLTAGYLVGPGANLDGADLTTADLAGVALGQVTGTPAALPAGYRLVNGYLVGPGASLHGANLANADLSGADLSAASLRGAKLEYASLSGADLSGADLSEANFYGADLTGAVLTGVTLEHTVGLQNASLAGIKSGGIQGSPADAFVCKWRWDRWNYYCAYDGRGLPAGWGLIGGYLAGPGTDLSGASVTGGADFGGVDLTGADLTGADLSGASFAGVRLSNALLRDAVLTSANLSGAQLQSADLTGVHVEGASFADADLTGVRSGGITGSPGALPDGWRLTAGYLVGPGANLDGADLTTADLAGVALGQVNGTPAALPAGYRLVNGYLVGPGASLHGANLAYADLSGVNLSGADLSQVDFYGADLSRAVLTGTTVEQASGLQNASLAGVRSGGIQGSPADHLVCKWWDEWNYYCASDRGLPPGWGLISGYLAGPGSDLSGASVAGGADFAGLDLTGADLTGADLSGASFAGVRLSNALLRDAVLTSANMSGAQLQSADLTGADLTGSNLASADIDGADFSGVTLSGVSSGGVSGQPAALPEGYRAVNGYIVGRGVNLSGADLSGVDLSGADLSAANLIGANLAGSNLAGSVLVGADLSYSNMSNSDLADADLSDAIVTRANLAASNLVAARFARADLSYSDLSFTDMSETDFTDAVFYAVVIEGATGTAAAFPAGLLLLDGRIVGPGANLAGVDLSGMDLAGVDLSGAILTGANLDGTRLADTLLTSVRSGGVVGTPASLPSRWEMRDGLLAGPSADLSGMDLSGRNLALLDLTGADLHGSVVTNADFTESVLTGANIDEVAGMQDASLARVRSGQITGSPLTMQNCRDEDQGYWAYGWVYYWWGRRWERHWVSNWQTVCDYEGTGLPDGWQLRSGHLVGPEANLAGADLHGADLRNVNFSGADLSAADLSEANVTGASFRRANLAGANIQGMSGLMQADLVGVSSGGLLGSLPQHENCWPDDMGNGDWTCDGTYVVDLPNGWRLLNGYLVGRDAVLIGADLSHQDLSGLDLGAVDLSGANLSGANLSGVRLGEGAALNDANLTEANIDGIAGLHFIALDRLTVSKLTGQPALLRECHMEEVEDPYDPDMNYSQEVCEDTGRFDLPVGWAFARGMLIGKGSDLRGMDFSGEDLRGVNLAGNDMTGANFSRADLRGADLSGATLIGVDLYKTNLTGANLTWVASSGIIGLPTLPDGWRVVHGYLLGEGARVPGASLGGVDLAGVNLAHADLRGALFTQSNLSGANLHSAWADSADFSGADLTSADLSNGVFSGADFSGTNLTQADVYRAVLDAATFTSVRSGGLIGLPVHADQGCVFAAGDEGLDSDAGQWCADIEQVLPMSWGLGGSYRVLHGYIVGPAVDLRGASLVGADLSGLDLSGALISGGRFGKATWTDSICPDGTAASERPGGACAAAPSPVSDVTVVRGTTTADVRWLPPTIDGGAPVTSYRVVASPAGPQCAIDGTMATCRGLTPGVGYQFSVTGLNAFGESEPTVSEVALSRFLTMPVPTTSGTAVVGGDLSVQSIGWERGTSLSYRWFRGQTAIDGATDATYTVTPEDAGSWLHARVSATKPGFLTDEQNTVSVLVARAVMSDGINVEVSGDNTVNQEVSASVSGAPDGADIAYQWVRDGIAIAGATGDVYRLGASDAGRSIKVRVSVSATGYTPMTVASEAFSVNKADLLMPAFLSLDGGAAVGRILVVPLDDMDPDAKFSYQWYVDAVPLLGATKQTYTPTVADLRHTISVRVRASRPGFNTAEMFSDEVEIAPGTLDDVPTPVINGNAKVGSTLTVVPGAWPNSAQLSYQWTRDGAPIANAINTSYKLIAADKNKVVGVTVTARLLGYNPASATAVLATKPSLVRSASSRSAASVSLTAVKAGSRVKVAVRGAPASTQRMVITWTLNGRVLARGATPSITLPTSTRAGNLKVRVDFISRAGKVLATTVSPASRVR